MYIIKYNHDEISPTTNDNHCNVYRDYINFCSLWERINKINQKYKISEFDITDYDEIDEMWLNVNFMYNNTNLVDKEDLLWLEKVCEIEY